ncbi:MAG: hypothetical protein ACRYF2_17465 [Janthinobacterium lividum]
MTQTKQPPENPGRFRFRDTRLCLGESVVLSGLDVTHCTIDNNGPRHGAIIKLRQMGLVPSTLDVAIALGAFRPSVVSMSGICAGLSGNATLGELIVASPAWEYQAGKWSENGFEIAPTQIILRPATRVKIAQAFEQDDLLDVFEHGLGKLGRPGKRHKPSIKPFATGSAVIADSRRLEHIKQQHRKVAGLDMETFGLYYAAHEAAQQVPHFFSVKCVVDLADKDKGDDLHEYGCAMAARAAVHLIGSLFS